MENSYRFFRNTECVYFPCHKTEDSENFSCLFCYCPLYVLGKDCGGSYKYLENGIKDCSGCMLPHKAESYDFIVSKFEEIRKILK